MFYIFIEDNKINGYGQCRLLNDNVINYEVEEAFYNEFVENPNKYIWDGLQVVVNPNYEAEQELKERERVNKLTCTKRVFALMLQELGITYAQLKELIASNEQAQLEWDLCVELERGNPLLDVMASQLGITSAQLDGLFKYANGEITLDEFRGLYVKSEEELSTNEVIEQQGNTEVE